MPCSGRPGRQSGQLTVGRHQCVELINWWASLHQFGDGFALLLVTLELPEGPLWGGLQP